MDSSDSGEVLLAISDEGDRADAVEVTTLTAAGLLERSHLQEWVVAHPMILGSGVKIVTVEYDAWVVAGDSQSYRLDVLGLDSDGRLVVAELKPRRRSRHSRDAGDQVRGHGQPFPA